MAEYWVVEDKHGKAVYVPCLDEQDAIGVLLHADKEYSAWSPHRLVHLVEAGTVEPEVAEVVKLVVGFQRAEVAGDLDDWIPGSIHQAALKLKPHQLRACGIEVESAAEKTDLQGLDPHEG